MVTCSNSALPLFADDILQPLTPLWNVDVSNVPAEFITKLFDADGSSVSWNWTVGPERNSPDA